MISSVSGQIGGVAVDKGKHRVLKGVYPPLAAQPEHSAVHLLTFLCAKAALIQLTASSSSCIEGQERGLIG